MERRKGFLPVFLVVAILCVIILALSVSGKLKFLSFLEKPTSGIQSLSYNLFQKTPFISVDSRVKKLEETNLELLSRVADYEKLKRENAALSDQFRTPFPASRQLLKAQVIGAPSFVPGVSTPNVFILDKGLRNNIRIGSAVVVGNNLIGEITRVSANLSIVNLVNDPSLSFTARTENGAVGIIKGGGVLTLDNVLLSENLREGELVFTKGDVNQEGIGTPQDLIVGKIKSVEKNPSDLFQKAKIESLVNFAKLSTVFVYLESK